MIKGLVDLATKVQVRAKQYTIRSKDVRFYFYVTKDNKIVFDIDADNERNRDRFLTKVFALADENNIDLRIMCAPADHLQRSTFYSELKRLQQSMLKFAFTQDANSWSFMTRVANPSKLNVETSSAALNNFQTNSYFSDMKDIKIGNTYIGQELQDLDDNKKRYCVFIIPQLIDDWFHGKLMHKKMRDVDLQLENEIIEAFMFLNHHFSIPTVHPQMIYRITRLKGVNLESISNVRKVRPALRPVQSWTKSADAAKVFFKDFFEKAAKQTEDVARIGLNKSSYAGHALIDRDQIEVYLKALTKFFTVNKNHPHFANFVVREAPTQDRPKYLKLSKAKPVESYLASLTNCSKFTLSPYIKKQYEIVLNIPRNTLLDIDECVPADFLD
jgi:hypothetical protein